MNNLKFIVTSLIIMSGLSATMFPLDKIFSEEVNILAPKKILLDNDPGHSRGWNPDGITFDFNIQDSSVSHGSSLVLMNTHDFEPTPGSCSVTFYYDFGFEVSCSKAPRDGSELHYAVLNNFSFEQPSDFITQQEFEEKAAKDKSGNLTSKN